MKKSTNNVIGVATSINTFAKVALTKQEASKLKGGETTCTTWPVLAWIIDCGI